MLWMPLHCLPLYCLSLLQSGKVFLSYQTATFASLSPEKITGTGEKWWFWTEGYYYECICLISMSNISPVV